ncbi:hypothetical protein CLF_113135, partial [Clonorchis sinensis]
GPYSYPLHQSPSTVQTARCKLRVNHKRLRPLMQPIQGSTYIVLGGNDIHGNVVKHRETRFVVYGLKPGSHFCSGFLDTSNESYAFHGSWVDKSGIIFKKRPEVGLIGHLEFRASYMVERCATERTSILFIRRLCLTLLVVGIYGRARRLKVSSKTLSLMRFLHASSCGRGPFPESQLELCIFSVVHYVGTSICLFVLRTAEPRSYDAFLWLRWTPDDTLLLATTTTQPGSTIRLQVKLHVPADQEAWWTRRAEELEASRRYTSGFNGAHASGSSKGCFVVWLREVTSVTDVSKVSKALLVLNGVNGFVTSLWQSDSMLKFVLFSGFVEDVRRKGATTGLVPLYIRCSGNLFTMPPKRNVRNKIDEEDESEVRNEKLKKGGEDLQPTSKRSQKKHSKQPGTAAAQNDLANEQTAPETSKKKGKNKKRDESPAEPVQPLTGVGDNADHGGPERGKKTGPQSVQLQPKEVNSDDDVNVQPDEIDDDFYTKKRRAGRGKQKAVAESETGATNQQAGKKKKKGGGKKASVDNFDSDKEDTTKGLSTALETLAITNEFGSDDDEPYQSSRFAKFSGLTLNGGAEEAPDVTEPDAVQDVPRDAASIPFEEDEEQKEPLAVPGEPEEAAPAFANKIADTVTAPPDLSVRNATPPESDVITEKESSHLVLSIEEAPVTQVKISKKDLKKLKKREEFDKLVEAAKEKIVSNSGTLDNFALSQ